MNILTQFGTHRFYQHRQNRYEDNFRRLRDGTHRSVRASGGYDQFGTGRIPGSIGEIVVGIWVDNTDENIEAQLDKIGGLANMGVQTLSMLHAGTASVRTCQARVLDIPYIQRAVSVPHIRQHIEIVFQVAEPFWLGAAQSVVEPPNTNASIYYPTINVEGTQVVYPEIEVAPTTSISSLEIQRLVGGQARDRITFTPSTGTSQTLKFDCEGTLFTLGGTAHYTTDLSYLRYHWFSLEPGANNLRVALNTGSEAQITFNYQPRYR